VASTSAEQRLRALSDSDNALLDEMSMPAPSEADTFEIDGSTEGESTTTDLTTIGAMVAMMFEQQMSGTHNYRKSLPYIFVSINNFVSVL